ncbi:MAG: CRISPR-associated endonuclease Cas1 [Deltaproteobacteria bacterium]|nr:MAG: CRISPR-associated endonuclease Cas1 [Deltaproteobacteria bacterium]
MAVVYIMEQGAYLVKEGERILVKKEKSILHTLHAFKLEQIVIFGNVSITPAAISYLLRLGIDTVFMSKNGRYKGRLQGPYSKNIGLRQKQFERFADPEFCLDIARSIVNGKINNMRVLILRLNRTKNSKDLELEDHIFQLKKLKQRLKEAKDVDEIRGIEGRASALYFEGFSKGFVSHTIEFTKRVRRPPTDPVNAILSLGYTFLFNEVLGAISMIGLDPYLGALHAIEYGRASLALDLMEEWRPVLIDTLVLSMFNLKAIGMQDFTIFKDHIKESDLSEDMPDLPVRLTNDGMRKFIIQFERKMKQKIRHHLTGTHLSYRDCIREQIRHFARHIKGDDPAYQPITFR